MVSYSLNLPYALFNLVFHPNRIYELYWRICYKTDSKWYRKQKHLKM